MWGTRLVALIELVVQARAQVAGRLQQLLADAPHHRRLIYPPRVERARCCVVRRPWHVLPARYAAGADSPICEGNTTVCTLNPRF